MARRRRRRTRSYDPLAALPPGVLNQLLNRNVNAAVLPARNELRRERMESRRLAQEEENRSRDAAAGVAQLLGEIAPHVQADYRAATGAQAGLARGLGDAQNHMQEADAAKASELLHRIGAPQSQVDQVAGMGAHVGDTSYAIGGKIPGDLLNEIGLSATATARELPAWALGRGQIEQGQMRKAQREKEAEFDAKLSDLMDKIPGLRAEEYKQLVGLELQKEAARTQRDYLGVAAFNANTTRDLGTGNLRQRRREARLHHEEALTDDQTAKDEKTKTGRAKARKERVTAFADGRESTYTEAADLYEGTPETYPGTNEPTGKTVRLKAPQAYKKLWLRYGQELMRYAPPGQKIRWRRQVENMIWNALSYASDGAWKRPRKPPKHVKKEDRPGPN